MKKQKGFTLVGILLLIGALLLTASGVLVWRQKASPNQVILPTLQPSLLPTNSSKPGQEILQIIRCNDKKIENEYLLVLKPIPDVSHCKDLDWEQKGKCVFEYLKELSEKAQKEIIEHLNANSVSYETFYINNSILLKNIDERQLQLIYNQFKDKIEYIRENCLVHIMD